MSSSVQAKKWREQNPNYSKNWYQANKERIREQARKKYHESVVAKRLENASAQLDEEEWKQIPDFENYKVNKHGEVKNKFGKTLLPGKIPSTGYLHVSLSNKEVKGKHFYVHQLVWKAFNGEIPDGLSHELWDTEGGGWQGLLVRDLPESEIPEQSCRPESCL